MCYMKDKLLLNMLESYYYCGNMSLGQVDLVYDKDHDFITHSKEDKHENRYFVKKISSEHKER